MCSLASGQGRALPSSARGRSVNDLPQRRLDWTLRLHLRPLHLKIVSKSSAFSLQLAGQRILHQYPAAYA